MLPQFLTSDSGFQSAVPILTDAALKGAILVAIAAVAAYFLRNRSAASRHAAWTAAVIGHLAIPGLVLLLPAWKMPVIPAASWMGVQTHAPIPSAVVSAPQTSAKVDAGKPAALSSATDSKSASALPSSQSKSVVGTERPGIIPIVAAIWFTGALLVLLRLAFGTWRVGQLARDGARVEDGVWLSLAQRLANGLGVTRPLILLRGERLAVPVTWGIVYPAVLLPQDADTWSDERRRFVRQVSFVDALVDVLRCEAERLLNEACKDGHSERIEITSLIESAPVSLGR